MPVAPALAPLPVAGGLPANLGVNPAQAAQAAAPPSAVIGGNRAAAAALAAQSSSLSANASPGTNTIGLGINPAGSTGPASGAASTAAIEVQAFLDSPSSFINSTIQDANNLDDIVSILDPVPGVQGTATSTNTNAIQSSDLFVTLFNASGNSL